MAIIRLGKPASKGRPKDPVEIARPTGFSKESISTLGEELAELLGYKPGDRLDSIVTDLGGEIIYRNDSEWLDPDSGTIRVEGPDKFTIYLPRFTSAIRDRFTIAHEIGHYILHSNLGEKRVVVTRQSSEEQTSRIEWEANWFAAAFLMPKKIFTKEYNKNKNNISALAGFFGVSQSAISVRCKSLGLS